MNKNIIYWFLLTFGYFLIYAQFNEITLSNFIFVTLGSACIKLTSFFEDN